MSHASIPSLIFSRLRVVGGMALLLLGLLQNLPAQAARLALVIGNDAYRQIEPLKNARNDARLMATTLKEAGFEVERVHENLDRKDMLRAINGFKARVTKADEVVFFYAGHGIQIGRQSPVLLPVDITQENDDQIVQDGVQLSTVQDALTGAGFALLVIDACREDPFPRKSDGTRGMARQTGLELSQPPKGSMVLMSAGKGEKALDYVPDGTRGNGLFTHEFVQAIKTPGRPLLMAISEVKARVPAKAQRAGNNQNPAYADDSTGGSFVFFAGQLPVVALSVIAPALQLASEQEVEQKLWNFIEASSDVQDFQDYLKRYPNGRFAPLAQRQLRVLTARQQPLPPVQAPVLASVSAPVPAQSSAAAPISGALGKRVALLIGNEGSFDMPLETPFRDIQLIESTLLPLGFTVKRLRNASRSQMVSAISSFQIQALSADIALIYFAGQGYRVSGTDYVKPYDMSSRGGNLSTLALDGFAVEKMVQAIEQQAKFGIVIVDAGREELAGFRGLRPVLPVFDGISIGSPMAIVFSTKPGTSPADSLAGLDRLKNSPFATTLAAHLKKTDLSIVQVFEQASLEVMAMTKGVQEPSFGFWGGQDIYLAKHLSTGPAR